MSDSFSLSRSSRRLLAALCLLGGMGPVAAVDLLKDHPTGLGELVVKAKQSEKKLDIWDFRLGIETVSGWHGADLTAPAWGGNVSLDRQWSYGARPSFALGTFFGGSVGVVGSLALPWRRLSGKASNGDIFRADAFGLEFTPALALRLPGSWHLEIGTPLGVGFSRASVPGFAGDQGAWRSVGARLGAYWTAEGGLQAGSELGYQTLTSTGSLDNGHGKLDATYFSRGFALGFVVGKRF